MIGGFGPRGRKNDAHHLTPAERKAKRRRNRRRRAAAAAAAAAFAGGAGLAAHQDSGGGSSTDSTLLRLHNDARHDAGCGPLHLDSKLDKAAEGKADDMARFSYMSHTNHDGSFFDKRITKTGYDWSTVGENIGEGFSSASSVMTAWLNSPEHRANILKCAYTQVGFGEKDGYWSAEFARPR